MITASKPPQPIPSGLPGPGLLAQVLASKYADHIPLHRFERISARHGVELSRRTTCDWAMACADLFRPLYHLMIDEVLASWVVHTDDTTVKIRDATKKLQLTGYLWVYYGDGRHPLIVFDYTSTHSRDGPARFLGEYRGYLQADAAGVYDELYNKPGQLILEAGCRMHARRYFFEARRLDPLRAGIALARIRELYAVERRLTRLREGEWRELPLPPGSPLTWSAGRLLCRLRPWFHGRHQAAFGCLAAAGRSRVRERRIPSNVSFRAARCITTAVTDDPPTPSSAG